MPFLREATAGTASSTSFHSSEPITPPDRYLRSELERRFVDFCREHGLPIPSTNVWLEEFEVDAYWPEHRVVVELDSWEFHRTRDAFERDRTRDGRLQAAGHRTVRVTNRRMSTDPARLAAELRALLVAQA